MTPADGEAARADGTDRVLELFVDFGSGGNGTALKSVTLAVRAVRGGS